jgi:hypothetical protein
MHSLTAFSIHRLTAQNDQSSGVVSSDFFDRCYRDARVAAFRGTVLARENPGFPLIASWQGKSHVG